MDLEVIELISENAPLLFVKIIGQSAVSLNFRTVLLKSYEMDQIRSPRSLECNPLLWALYHASEYFGQIYWHFVSLFLSEEPGIYTWNKPEHKVRLPEGMDHNFSLDYRRYLQREASRSTKTVSVHLLLTPSV